MKNGILSTLKAFAVTQKEFTPITRVLIQRTKQWHTEKPH